MARIRISGRDIRFVSLFERLTGTFPKDCLYNKESGEVIFVVKHNQMGKVIGRSGTMIARLREEFERDVRVIQYDETPESFVINALKPARIQKATLEKLDGRKVLRLLVSSDREKGRAVGKHGRNINRARLLVRRHFGIQDIIITIMADWVNAETERPERAIASNTESSPSAEVLQQMEQLCIKDVPKLTPDGSE